MSEKNANGRNLCIFGGTFDPPHISHTLGCLYALETCGIDRILVIPCHHHPLGKNATPFHHRAAMCRLAMENLFSKVEVSEMESERPGPSYTIDTLKIIREKNPMDNLHIMIGSDILKETRLWKSFDEIERMAQFIILPRPVFDRKEPGEREEFTLPDISSTRIREILKEGGDASRFLSVRVLEYIREHHLYM
ncbi:nicotinate (nicotinamide) nucleotide adenylyltransferase [Candidatus Sumerlaeota bacterium]|nr:nicotinate (nicotinamide) nucleotide adenylyltransferase [Candidatus Sumerlaeota bacterium]